MLRSVSFWILFWAALLSWFIGSHTHWIVGWILFFIIAGKSLLIGLIMDTISSTVRYHHDRQDSRAKKIIASLMPNKFPGDNNSRLKNYNIRR